MAADAYESADAINLAAGTSVEPFCGSTTGPTLEAFRNSHQNLLADKLPHTPKAIQLLAEYLFYYGNTIGSMYPNY